jgi:hypothetical protein
MVEQGCPICESEASEPFFSIDRQPVTIGVLYPDPASARECPMGDLQLIYCQSCGFIYNRAFNPADMDYTEEYDNSLHFSPTYQEYARSTAQGLIDRYQLREKNVIEIGCGKGDFLVQFCEMGNNKGVGFDPSYAGPRTESPAIDQIEFIREYYDATTGKGYPADLICSRYVLEHVPQPVQFLAGLCSAFADGVEPVLYFEVPNAHDILSQLSIFGIIYEHCSNFGANALQNCFSRAGFEMLRLESTYQNQFLTIETRWAGKPAHPQAGLETGELEATGRLVTAFGEEFRKKTDGWRETLERFKREGRRVVMWGAGAKGVGFTNMLGIDQQIEYMVDINPNKQGKCLAGTGQRIVPPEFLREVKPDVIILMNEIYAAEIRKVTDDLGLKVEFLAA